ncbi:hypothetical protein PFICI_08741 [Pestalotiopsis fici W106-1]|uniref:Methyltransferase CmcJ n=1 Tax=Pestalotiopsis fici (strain W106-1 / CGMCC3.15140) TaxID=1229662 RepID=W3WYD5_PESFW|nr:uncharacterized protein PFICI_08741 [Pestalotiopsis fici W106-1]ETS78888.1 hypothetical protein PFICI_08741 [Pestalotiopsis fici W106-1]
MDKIYYPVQKSSADPRTTNLEFEVQEQTFLDMRESLNSFSLDIHGFESRLWPTQMDTSDFQDREKVESCYFDEAREILKTIDEGYDNVYFFDWRLRDASAPRNRSRLDMNDLTTWLLPSQNVHIDQSAASVLKRVQLHLPDDAENLLQGRVRVINIWRPIRGPVEDYPLALCDGTSVSDVDLIACDHVRRNFKGETIYPYYSPNQKWYYLSKQEKDEVLLIKMFDSDPSVKASMTFADFEENHLMHLFTIHAAHPMHFRE